ncbi:transglutaminase-like domain-containing protein [Sphingomonas carotinifaciens]|uniref:Transglutaminase family protein n=1 Tax=Sphingomonas carotinifaciens TaxID=1166323 RepID=A0A1G7KBD3_9SPHN|nr:transglutaminase family protein [Sphingomonas carotinifaciens]MBB4085204.1 transglutaminase-like putative cysteine protease [Sphingomonas carotinifaciens]MWC43769.1 transglutaminase family protein [Sphingomonas carotinifaciens]SDF34472.1 Transglutaminase-like enzyme, putative cysteine protease [Sphingomonas carotinifaciens]
MRLSIEVRLDYGFAEPADVLLQVEAAAMADQRIEQESLILWSDTAIAAVPGEDGIGQRCWARGEGRLVAEYRAVVQVERPAVVLADYGATPARALPGAVVAYLMPSRYCPSDRFEGFVRAEFAGLSGGALAQALADWVRASLRYRAGTSSGVTTALDTFAMRAGVCRDYAHLLVALARAAAIPARCVSAYAPGVDPPDFHAVAELWLDGAWRLVDPTGMASCRDIARVAVGRDATDIAFMTIWGEAVMYGQSVTVRELC